MGPAKIGDCCGLLELLVFGREKAKQWTKRRVSDPSNLRLHVLIKVRFKSLAAICQVRVWI